MTMMTQMQNLNTTPLTPTRLMTIQAKHLYTAPVCSTTSELPQHPLDDEEPDDIELPKLETQVPVLC